MLGSFDDAWQAAWPCRVAEDGRETDNRESHYASTSAIGTEAPVAKHLRPHRQFWIYAINNMAFRFVNRSRATSQCRMRTPGP